MAEQRRFAACRRRGRAMTPRPAADVESGQHDRAVRQPRNHSEQFAVAGIEPVEPAAMTGPGGRIAPQALRLEGDQRVAMRGRVGLAALRKTLRPVLGDDLQEIERNLPPARDDAFDARAGKLCPVGTFGLDSSISRARSRASQIESPVETGTTILPRTARDMRGQSLLPCAHQRRQQQQAIEIGDRRRKVEDGGAARHRKRLRLSSNSPSAGWSAGCRGGSACAARQARCAARARRGASAR